MKFDHNNYAMKYILRNFKLLDDRYKPEWNGILLKLDSGLLWLLIEPLQDLQVDVQYSIDLGGRGTIRRDW